MTIEVNVFDYGIRILYPIIGLVPIIVSFGYLYFGISNPKVIQEDVERDSDAIKIEKKSEEKSKVQKN